MIQLTTLQSLTQQFPDQYTLMCDFVTNNPDIAKRASVIALLAKPNPTVTDALNCQDYAQELLALAIAEHSNYSFTPGANNAQPNPPYGYIGMLGPWLIIEDEWRMNALAYRFVLPDYTDAIHSHEQAPQFVEGLWFATSGFEPTADQIITLPNWLQQLI